MYSVAIVGTGKIGQMICDFLYHSHDYAITVIDQNEMSLRAVARDYPGVITKCVSVQNRSELEAALSNQQALINSGPFNISVNLAGMASAMDMHYFDLTEDVASTRAIKKISKAAHTAFVPQCGLAPGFISIAAYDMARRFDELHNVHMRVGALPKFPSNGLKYNLTWSTEGLINEYLNPCEAIVNGELKEVRPLEELEHFSLDGADYEAFNTSGGLGTLCETLKGKVDNLNYRTVRYPGHRDAMKLLLQDLRLGEKPDLFKEILESAIPVTLQDVVLIFISVSGMKSGGYVQETYVRKLYGQSINGKQRSAIQITTAASACAVVDMVLSGVKKVSGFVKQEEFTLEDFLSNRFGHYYQSSETALSSYDADSISEAKP